jgi:folylpolyglutamate synthase/dihydropteroate synthase
VFLDTLFFCHDTIDLAYSSVRTSARKGDLVVVFGSFRIVSPVMHLLGL